MAPRFDYFVIFAEMRTGSNLLEATLAQVPGIHCYGEIFNPDHLGNPKTESVLGITMEARLADPLALVEQVRAAPGFNGFRYFFDHEPRVLEHLLNDPRCAKIVLNRNPVDCYISLKIAYNTKRWQLTDVKDRIAWRPPFKPAEFEAFLADRQAFQIHLLNALQVTGQTAFYLDYEDSLRVDVINGLFEFLGIEGRISRIADTLVRQNPEEMADKVRNFPEMEVALARIDWSNLSRSPNFEPRRGPGIPRALAAAGAPLLYVPLPPFRDDHLRGWLAGLGSGGLVEDFTQKSLRAWKRKAGAHRSFTVLRHPLARAHDAFTEILGSDEHAELRATLRRHYAVPLPKDEDLAGLGDKGARKAHHAAFLGFLGFVKVNLGGQTSIRPDVLWGSQWSVVNGFGGFVPPDLLCREERLAADVAYLADTLGVNAPPLPAAIPPGPELPRLAKIYDRDLEAVAREAYRRDYLSFGFGGWKPPK